MNFNLVYQNQTHDSKKKIIKQNNKGSRLFNRRKNMPDTSFYYHITVLATKLQKDIGSNVTGVALSVGLILQDSILSDNTHLVFQITLTKLPDFQSYLWLLIKLKIKRSMESMEHHIKGLSP